MDYPTREEIERAQEQLKPYLTKTPVWKVRHSLFQDILGKETSVFFKFELWQYAGSFKTRAVFLNLLALSELQKKQGVIAVSAGNHAIAVSYAANVLGIPAKVLMKKTVDPYRIARCKRFAAEVILTETFPEAFEIAEKLAKEENRFFVHPFEGKTVAMGTGTLGLEILEQIADLDAVVVAIGGGGLIAGVSCAIKQVHPHCKIYGVEPEGANTMQRSFVSGKPEAIETLDTIADSLAAPSAKPYSFSLAKQFVEEVVTVSDQALRDAMHLMFDHMKMAVEPGAVAGVAAIRGPLAQKLKGKRVAVIICGSNIGLDRFIHLLSN